MRRSVQIDLIRRSFYEDENAVRLPYEEVKTVFAYVNSVSQSEFFEGSRTGMRPEMRFTIQLCDFDDEDIISYDGKRYTIYRTFTQDNWIELYAERRKGTEKA